MAEITNGVKKIDRKKDLYNHVSFDDLYAYNDAILNIHHLSKTLFTQYIVNATEYWRKQLDMKGYLGVSFGSFKGDVENEIYHMPIKTFRDDVDVEDSPKELCASIIEIVDPYDIILSMETSMEIEQRLKEYISLGLYPLVSAPMSEARAFHTFIKYDDLRHDRDIIGTIIDINSVGDCSASTLDGIVPHIVATVLWEPSYSDSFPKELILSKNGDLHLQDIIPTPEVWKERDNGSVTNFGIPVYEFKPMRMTLANVTFVDGFVDYFNEAIVTGNLKFDFVDKVMSMLNATGDINAMMAERMEEKTAKALPPEAASQDLGVPVEDASITDDFGHRLRLYDEPGPSYDDRQTLADFMVDD